jgi:hypothetical protein
VTIRIAMWSGPRNISTAMMRSWENRNDAEVVDEPFYGCYLLESGLEHPCREEVLASQSCSRNEVISQLTQSDSTVEIFYQKHMTHHMPRGMDMRWCKALHHCFLIRDPAQVIASYLNKMPVVSQDAIGIVRQEELFNEITDIIGYQPAVIDSNDVLRDPAGVLEKLCGKLNVPWHADTMLHWPPGRRDSDGVWASHWYQSVERSIGFAEYDPRVINLSPEHATLADEMLPYYQRLASLRLRP